MRTNLKHRLTRLEQRRQPPRLPVILLKMIDGQRYRQTGEPVTDSDMQALRASCDAVITIVPADTPNCTPSDNKAKGLTQLSGRG